MRSLATKHNDPDAKLGWGERLGYGAGGFGINAINGIIGTFMTIYMTNVALLDAGILSTLIAVSKVFDGISDIIVGRMVDRTHSKLGKARVWLIRMCIPFAVSVMLLFFVPKNFPEYAKYIYVFLMYNVVNTICLTSMLVPFFSMISLISRNAYERGLLGTVQQIFQTLGNVVVNALFVRMLWFFSSSADSYFNQQAFSMTVLVFCIIMLITSLIAVLFTKERVHDSREDAAQAEDGQESGGNAVKKESFWETLKALFKNKYWVLLILANFVIFFVVIFYSIGGVYYAQYIFGDMGQISWMNNAISIAQLLVMFIIPLMMKKMSKSSIYILGIGAMTAGFLGFGLTSAINSVPVMIVMNVLKGLGLGLSGGIAMGLVSDAILVSQLKSGIDAVGVGNAGSSAAQKLGLGIGQALFGIILSASGFDPKLDLAGKAQPASTIHAIQFMYTWIPFVLCLIIFLLLLVFFRGIDQDLGSLKRANGIVEE
jgi:GPH family glycoside/pentoside/hexuronide:cation symporter